MPKIKTKKVLAKKVQFTGTGKIRHSHQLRAGHLRRNKSKSALRRHKKPIIVSKTIAKNIRRLLGK